MARFHQAFLKVPRVLVFRCQRHVQVSRYDRSTIEICPRFAQMRSSVKMQRILKFSLALTFLLHPRRRWSSASARTRSRSSLRLATTSPTSSRLALSVCRRLAADAAPPPTQRTFGYQRAGVLAGFVNAAERCWYWHVWILICGCPRASSHPVTVEAAPDDVRSPPPAC